MSENYFEFKPSISKEWKELFNKKNISDCVPFLQAAQNRICYSIYDLFAYDYANDEWKKRQMQMTDLLIEKGSVTEKFFNNSRIIYCGNEMEYNFFYNKINFSFFNALHSFFDVYGKFLLKALLPTYRVPTIYFFGVVNKLDEYNEYNEIVKKIRLYTESPKFDYVYDLNNFNKHNQDIAIESILFINDGSTEADIQGFKQKNNTHQKENMSNKLEETEKFVIDFYNEITEEVIRYLRNE